MKAIQDIMTKDVACCTSDDNLFEAATMMKQRNVGSVPVCDNDKNLLGMVTDRDLVIRGYAQKKSGSSTIQEVMSDKLTTCTPETSIEEASKIMSEKQIRRLPVVENGKLVGIVSLGDLSLEKYSNEAAGHALEEISERPEVH
ncbi:CBS domain-containing protein [Pontibacillus yanchengensis]|uniref:CBS domain-containing protein n=2 Tax=Pontibacillus yanchengensis TaxID=462910 RepID=A0ACC7VDC0_9BACI|nr:CBS domain-containing protein [Pontibacillus yanchengensis]MYL33015.1 CBS domain-containing protein [Pontibacillus yanchengensis]MYL52135.1 CBS domain-containing protein [Pontibacillus yanchengensis]